eukprot:TRINITY_DN107356_c0_g1_i1.p2 TRINITY_DN107356_c0_g1~~TRINITY_DN107356_c0_g1_i1.p2  ORF type:complete len:179 (+),score=18.58 TRINITY_DN107356_c0_g1_i1:63-599(+)
MVSIHDCHSCEGHCHAGTPYDQSLEEVGFQKSACYYAQTGQITKLKQVLDKNPCAIASDGVRNLTGYTPLHYAARAGQIEAVRLLLQYGAEVNARLVTSQATSLHRAAVAGQLEIVKMLVENRADGMMQDADGETALHKAIRENHEEVVNFLCTAFPESVKIKDKHGRCPQDFLQEQT